MASDLDLAQAEYNMTRTAEYDAAPVHDSLHIDGLNIIVDVPLFFLQGENGALGDRIGRQMAIT